MRSGRSRRRRVRRHPGQLAGRDRLGRSGGCRAVPGTRVDGARSALELKRRAPTPSRGTYVVHAWLRLITAINPWSRTFGGRLAGSIPRRQFVVIVTKSYQSARRFVAIRTDTPRCSRRHAAPPVGAVGDPPRAREGPDLGIVRLARACLSDQFAPLAFREESSWRILMR